MVLKENTRGKKLAKNLFVIFGNVMDLYKLRLIADLTKDLRAR